MGRVQLPNSAIYVPEDSNETMQTREWASYLSIVDGVLNLVPFYDLDQPMLKEVMAENSGLLSYIPTSTYFTKRVHIKCQGCPTSGSGRHNLWPWLEGSSTSELGGFGSVREGRSNPPPPCPCLFFAFFFRKGGVTNSTQNFLL